ncbi:hypothetical protein J4460_04395 [Candidatus Woesearchaeota archaeon]|nr:hypothetical protein [Candidatus Woesearchaeota archaeon]HIH37726.1 hypothetical protein [Candidatus Woesearchaeota archaeon]HIH48374.1 hypothetical protein [Candidatus Woesearchaeota archaeon]HIJ02679.1 hypothetical protein [Candidatus Woesearchaeota archaeon]
MANELYYTSKGIFDVFGAILKGVIDILPGLIAAAIILIIGYFIALGFAWILHKLLDKLKVDKWMKAHKLDEALGKNQISVVLSTLTKWYIFFLFLIPAAERVSSVELGKLFADFARWLPGLAVAIIIMLFGFIVAELFANKILFLKKKGMKLAADAVKFITVLFFALIALDQINVDVSFAQQVILLIIGAFCLAIALAIGVGLGIGLKDEAKDLIKDVKKRL